MAASALWRQCLGQSAERQVGDRAGQCGAATDTSSEGLLGTHPQAHAGDRYISRGARQRNLEGSPFGNPDKVAVFGRSEAVSRCELLLRKDNNLQSLLLELAGARLVCHCRFEQTCHVDSIISVYRDMFPEAYDRDEEAAAASSAEVLNMLASLREEPDSDEGSTADEGAPAKGAGWTGRGLPMQIESGYTRRGWRRLVAGWWRTEDTLNTKRGSPSHVSSWTSHVESARQPF